MPREGRLDFTFADYDYQQTCDDPLTPEGVKCVDFILSRNDTVELLVEVKDPAIALDTYLQAQQFIADLHSTGFVEKLAAKAWGTYLHLHLTARPMQPLRYIAYLHLSEQVVDAALLNAMTDKLAKRVHGERGTEWKVPYVHSAVLLSTDRWSQALPDCIVSEAG